MSAGTPANATLAIGNAVEQVWQEFEVDAALLRPGLNVVALRRRVVFCATCGVIC